VASIVRLGETPLRTGAVVSTTVTVNVVVEVFPATSLAEQLTGVAPIAKVLPGAGVQVTGRTPSITSMAVGFV